MIENLAPGENAVDTQCDEDNWHNDEPDVTSGDYEFSQEYAVYGWVKSEPTCEGDSVAFRVVIDTPEEGNSIDASYPNPNFADDGEFKLNE